MNRIIFPYFNFERGLEDLRNKNATTTSHDLAIVKLIEWY